MGVASSVAAVQDDLDEAVSVEPAQVGGHCLCHPAGVDKIEPVAGGRVVE